jgi:hypothetical protein
MENGDRKLVSGGALCWLRRYGFNRRCGRTAMPGTLDDVECEASIGEPSGPGEQAFPSLITGHCSLVLVLVHYSLFIIHCFYFTTGEFASAGFDSSAWILPSSLV